MSYKYIPFYPYTYKIIDRTNNINEGENDMKNEDLEIINRFAKERNIKNTTKANYKTYLKEYGQYFNKSLPELLELAEQEEEDGIRWKNRSLKKQLIDYRNYLYNTHSSSTAKNRFTRIKTFYRHYDIEIHELPKFNTRNVKNTPPIQFKDIPDKEVIRSAIEVPPAVMKPLILFMSSSGCARAETLDLTIDSYIKATEEYHQGGTIKEIIETLNKITDVVPTFNILRRKTNKYYTTFCSPETVTAINHYLLTRENLTLNSQLFKVHETYLIELFENTNNALGLGKVGHYNRFRSHMLRKYQATTLFNDGMSIDTVNDLQGKSKNATDSAYFVRNVEDLKQEYISHLPALQIGDEVNKVTVKSKEFVELELENKNLKEDINSLKADVQVILDKIHNVK